MGVLNYRLRVVVEISIAISYGDSVALFVHEEDLYIAACLCGRDAKPDRICVEDLKIGYFSFTEGDGGDLGGEDGRTIECGGKEYTLLLMDRS